MRIFALETDQEKLKSQFISKDETEIMTVHYHFLKFLGVFAWCTVLTLILVGIVLGFTLYSDVPLEWVIGAMAFLWLVLVFPKVFRSFIDWKHDFIVLTSDKIIIIDQSSIFKQKVTPINLESIASASAETQFWNTFPFGVLHLDLLEASGPEHVLPYITHAQVVVAKITEALTMFQRRKDLRRYPHGDPVLEQD